MRGTGSFTPIAITDTSHISLQIVKVNNYDSINAIAVYTSNVSMDYQTGGMRWPSGSENDYLWYLEPTLTADATHTGSFSGSLSVAPCTTGSLAGSVVLHANGVNTKYVKVSLQSNSGGVFSLVTFGKE